MLGLSACVRMPTDGPVTEVQTSNETAAPPGIDFDPKPPQPGESASEIVTHFLEAMKARPITTSVARQFLSKDAQRDWRPDDAIVTYGELGDPVGGNLSVAGAPDHDQRVRRPRGVAALARRRRPCRWG